MDKKTIAKVVSYAVIAIALVSIVGSSFVQVVAILAGAATLKFYVNAA